MLEDLSGYLLKWKKDGTRTYMKGTVMHLPSLDAGTGCVVTATETEIGRDKGRQALIS